MAPRRLRRRQAALDALRRRRQGPQVGAASTGTTSSPAGRRGIRLGALLVGLTVFQIWGTAAPALAHGGGAELADYSPASRISYTLALAASVLVAGAALLRPLIGVPTEGARRLIVTAGAAGVVATVVVAIDRREVGQYSASALLLAVGLAVLFRARAWPPVPIGGALVVLLAWDALRDGALAGLLMVGHVLVAAVWSAAVLASATAERGTRLAVARRLSPIAVASAAGATVTGVLSARDRGVSLDGIAVTSFGTVVLVKAALLVVVALLGLGVRIALRRRAGAPRLAGGLARAEFGAMVATVVVGVVLTSLPSPGPPPREGVPLLRTVTLDDRSAGVLVLPQRPGRNLVQVMTERYTELRVDGRTYVPKALPTAEGYWAVVDLPEGRSRLEIRQGGEVVQQVLDVGSAPVPTPQAEPDAECASAALGALLGGSQAPLAACPAQALDDRDAGALRALVVELDRRKAGKIRLVLDRTPRSTAAEKVVAEQADAAGIELVASGSADATLALAGWDAALTTLSALAKDPPPVYGTYLAPWLVQDPIVAATGTSPLSPLWFNPDEDAAVGYLLALRRVAPNQSATSAGLAAYLDVRAARGLTNADPGEAIRIFASTSGFEIMPMGTVDGAPMKHGVRVAWQPRGSLTPVSTPLPR
ncbi:MAG: hypothetical protein ACT4QF_13935 [Sporichthyaceae bacterium]